MTELQAIALSVVEGITEFLPISSTGHMIITSSLLGINKDEFTKLFEVCVQLGAILSVVVLYRQKFLNLNNLEFFKKLIVAVVPALFFGFLLNKKIDELLESPTTVGISLLIGGIVLLFVDKIFTDQSKDQDTEMTYKECLTIGMWQTLAMIPGISRSGATIVGAMQQKFNRAAAAEFSFFLAVPTMCAATGYKLLKALKTNSAMLFDHHNLLMLALGNIVAFVVATIAIRTLITYVQHHSFRAFGIYRIIVGLVVLGLVYTHHIS